MSGFVLRYVGILQSGVVPSHAHIRHMLKESGKQDPL